MTITAPFSEHLSEQWLVERTYHAQLQDGNELSVPNFTKAMKHITDFYVPISTWEEISQEEALATFQQGIPVLLYSERHWKHQTATSGIDYAVCYLGSKQGTFSNDSWKTWFASDTAILLGGNKRSKITFLRPSLQFPFTTHYTIIDSEGQGHEYADLARALRGFQIFPLQEVSDENQAERVSPQLCYYQDVVCPSGTYRLEFLGPHMDEQGYVVKEETSRLPSDLALRQQP